MSIYLRRSVLVALAFSFALTIASAPPVAAAVDSTALSRIVASFQAEERFNGAVLVAAGDEVVFEGGFGEADRAWHVPNRPDTLFLVGSVSKQFTSMLVLQLVSEGALSLDDTLGELLPDYPEDKAGITIHQLLSHSSGLPHYDGFEEIGIDLEDYLRLDRPVSSYVELIGRLKLQTEPGTEYSYSSMGYIVLAYIAEQATGKSYGRLLEERIASPLGIEDLGFAYSHEPVERLAHGYEYEIRKLEDGTLDLRYEPETYRDQSNKYSTGGVHATVRAIFRWTRAVLGDELLPAELRDRMFTPHAGTYGYGWHIESGEEYGLPEDVEVISHGGSLSGYRASVLLIDRGRYTLVALGNSDSSLSSQVTEALARYLVGGEPLLPNFMGTALAWRIVRDGEAVGRSFFARQKAAGFPGYLNNDFAYYAYSEIFVELDRPDLGLAMAEMGLEAHPASPMMLLAAAQSHHAAGEADAALAAAEAALAGAASMEDTPDFVEEHATELIEELSAEREPVAATP